jgi:hypothetical protein
MWTPGSSLATGDDYALKITQGSNTGTSPQFSITDGSTSTTSPITSTSTPTTSTTTPTTNAQTIQETTSSSAQQDSSTTGPISSTPFTDLASNTIIYGFATSTPKSALSGSSAQQPSLSQASNPSAGSATPNPAVASSSSSPSKGLSAGDKAAIGITVPLGILILLGAAFYYYRRMSTNSSWSTSTGAMAIKGAEMDGLDVNGWPILRLELPDSETESGRTYELPESTVKFVA